MSFTYTNNFDHNKIYNLLSSITDKGIRLLENFNSISHRGYQAISYVSIRPSA
jgi:hypothetical protein